MELLSASRGFLKCNFHCHTTCSDGRLQHDAHAVAGLALGILTGAVLQTLHDAQGIADRLMALAALDVHHSADAAGIVLELRVIQAKRRGVFRKLIHCLSHPYLSKYPLGRGTIRSLLHRKQKKRPRRVDFTLLERLCSVSFIIMIREDCSSGRCNKL